MSKRLPLVIVLLIATCLVFGALIAKEMTTPQSLPGARPQAAAKPAPADPAASPASQTTPAAPATPAGAYQVIATRNLFSPTRTEAPPPPPPSAAAPPIPVNLPPKPHLYGVVLQDGTPIAYLEDPTTKRVARYRVGDVVAGGTLKTINSDNVVLTRADGQISVRLHDPTRPRTGAPAGAGQAPGVPVPGAPGQAPAVPRPQSMAPPAVGAPPGVPSRRPLPPSVLGRALQGTDAPNPQ